MTEFLAFKHSANSKMKHLLIFIGVLVGVKALSQNLVDEMKSKIQENGIECAEKENASEDDLLAMLKNRVPTTHQGKCVLFCVFKKFNVMNEDGSFGDGDVDWMVKVKADDPDVHSKILNIYAVCEAKVGNEADLCDKAAALTTCLYHESQQDGLDKYLY